MIVTMIRAVFYFRQTGYRYAYTGCLGTFLLYRLSNRREKRENKAMKGVYNEGNKAF